MLAGTAALTSLVALSSPASAGRTTAAVDDGMPTFGVPRVVDPFHVYGEPDIAVNPKTGAIHASGPQGTGTQRSVWNVSVDNGDSYRILQNVPGSTVPSAGVPTKSAIAPGGGDTEIVFDRAGKAYFTDLYALECFAALTTADDGATTPAPNLHACPSDTADRQWQAVFDPAPSDHTVSPYAGGGPLVYLAYAGTGGVPIGSSTDGLNFSHLAGTASSSADGTPVVDQHTGKFLMPVGGGTGGLRLAVGVPDAVGDLTFHYQQIGGGTQSGVKFPVLTQDTARNLYLVYIRSSGVGQYQTFYTWSPPGANDEWNAWAPPVQISSPPAMVNVFPWAQAGGPGILDVAWYGTRTTMAELGSSGPSARKGEAWDLFFNQVTAADSNAPVSHQVVASPHPIHYNDICLAGTGCITGQGNRNMADFFKVTIGRDGRARIVYNDTSNGLVQGVRDTAADHQGAALVSVVTQNTGLNAYTGRQLTAMETTAPVNGTADPTGDALFQPLGGTNVPSADIKDVRLAITNGNLVVTAVTAGGLLSDAAVATKAPFAEMVLRWQSKDTLYHAVVEMPAGAPSAGAVFFAGATKSVDLCSVSGCKPNYLNYGGPPDPDTSRITGAVSTSVPGQTTYTFNVPLSAVPSSSGLFEAVMAFVTVSPVSYLKPQDSALDFADEVPLQIEGTKTFNFAVGAEPAPDIPESALTALLPVLGLLVVGVVYALRRRGRLA
jgi:hypothetical protein